MLKKVDRLVAQRKQKGEEYTGRYHSVDREDLFNTSKLTRPLSPVTRDNFELVITYRSDNSWYENTVTLYAFDCVYK